ncbi:MAG: metallophosphoesterase [Candidatus Omnitrophica bacterium]|nr:metallophosphoesterase [Candidatus Omnitrophota bacterium]
MEGRVKTYVIGDIHGAYKALKQCFERAKFDYKKDRLIVLGDVCDGYPDVKQCIDELLKVKHCDLVIGNHDLWVLDWALRGYKPEIWISQGGIQTMFSYSGCPMPQRHIDFLKGGQLWIERDEQVFVHGGFNPDISLASHSARELVWDRTLLDRAWKRQIDGYECQLGNYKDIFVGHTTTELYNTLQPIHVCNVWDVDTGAGWSGKLTIMDVDTKEYWQADLTQDLYNGTPNNLNGAHY